MRDSYVCDPFTVRRLATVMTIASLLACASAAPRAEAAPVDAASAACRAAIAKTASKLALTTMKAFDGCIKTKLKAGSGDCSTVAAADLQGKVGGAITKLTDAIADKCDDTDAAIALSEMVRCGVPVGSSIATFADVGTCLGALVPANVESLRAALLDPDYAGASSDTAKCINAIAKNATAIFKAVQKEKNKAIKASDLSGGESNYTDPGDPDLKISATITKASGAITGACSSLGVGEWSDVRACDDDAAGVADCVADIVGATAGGLTASAFDQPGRCPSHLRVLFRGGAAGGEVVGATDLDIGWTGLSHDLDSTDGNALRFDVNCGPATNNSCALCSIVANCNERNCRCVNDRSLECDEPFGADVDDCAGNTCEMFLSPPTPTPLSGVPVCTVTSVDQDLVGSQNYTTGLLSFEATLRRRIYSSAGWDAVCPTCEGGFCDGGQRAGLNCVVDAGSDFGNVSYDCPPSIGGNLTGSGTVSTFDLGTPGASLAAGLPCDDPLSGLDCPCSACLLDNTIACSSDAQCLALAAGSCGLDGAHGGEDRRPNGCMDNTCEDVGDEQGRCSGQASTFCDGIVKGNGEGIVSCDSNADCEPLIPGTGFCTLSMDRSCFLDPIVAEGEPGLGGGVLAAAFCVPTSAAPSVNSALGLPGPARMVQASTFTPYCSDGVTVWGTGGANCP